MRVDLELLRCPVTGRPLDARNGRLTAGDRSYPVIAGVPVLIASDRSIFHAENYSLPTPARHSLIVRIMHRVDRRLPSLGYDPGKQRRLAIFERLLPVDGRMLVIGAGQDGRVIGRCDVDVVTSDVFIGKGIDVVCDGHDLPFADESFDAVFANAVLEHVADPPRVVAEVTRVLKPGGIAYSEIPFLQHVHAGAHDFTRYTLMGHRRLFAQFDSLVHEATSGPASAVAWALEGLLLAAVGRNRSLWLLASRLSSIFFGPIALIDRWLAASPGGPDAATGTVFIGRKRPDRIMDRELLADYRGACPTPRTP